MKILSTHLTLLLIMCAASAQQTQIIGHRGAMGHAPENTVLSVQKALALGVDGIEIDVFRCQSGEIVVFHDIKLENLTNGTGSIENKTLAQLQELLVMGREQIPTLDEIIEVIDGRVRLNIELKGKNTSKGVFNIMQRVVESGQWKMNQLYVSSFDWEELREFRKLTNQFGIAVLTDKNPLDAIPVAHELNAFAINPNHNELTLEIIKQIQGEGFEILTWTVNDTTRMNELTSWGVDAIITDFPERSREKQNQQLLE
jgi:glycerophosphoryl diester phosphodiesterase